MMIPPAESESHATRARFNEAPGHEKMFHQLGTAVVAVLRVTLAVAGANLLVLLLDVERIEQPARSKDAEGLFVEGVKAAHHAAAVDVAAELVEVREQVSAVREAVQRDAVQNHVVLAAAFVRL